MTLRLWGAPIMTVVLVVVVAALLLPGLVVGPSLDATIFSTVGWRLAAGDALYAEVWEQKPPGVFLPYAVAHVLTDESAIAWGIVWAVTLASIVGTALVIRRILSSAGVSDSAAAVVAALAAMGAGSYLLSLGGGMSESFAILPLALAFLLAAGGRWFACGIVTGIALAISFQSMPLLVAIAALGITPGIGGTFRRAGLVAGGAAVIVAVAALGLWLTGGLWDAADALIRYPSAYVAVARRGGGESAWSLLPWTVLVLLPLVIGVGLALLHRRRLASSRLAVSAAAWMVVAIVLIGLQGRFYAHYATPLVIPMGILGGLGIDAARRSLPPRASSVLIGIPLAFALALSLIVGAVGARDEEEPVAASNRRAESAAARIRSLSESDAAIFVWGNDARVYELAGRRPATRYVYLYPLLTPGYATDALMEEVRSAFLSGGPTVVVDTGSLAEGEPGLPPLLIDRPVATDGRDLDLLDPIRAIVANSYALDDVIEGWPLYVRAER